MRRARDDATDALLYHSTDGGSLYHCNDPKYLFCTSCDREGRDPYIHPGRNVSMRPAAPRRSESPNDEEMLAKLTALILEWANVRG